MCRAISLQLTPSEISGMFAHEAIAENFPPVLTLDQAAVLVRNSKGTLRDWRSQGRLDACTRKLGKHVRILRHRFVSHSLNHGLPREEFRRLTNQEVEEMFVLPVDAQKFPSVLVFPEASDRLQIPIGTLRDWRSRGLLHRCCRKVGGEVRFFRNRLLTHLFNDGLRAGESR